MFPDRRYLGIVPALPGGTSMKKSACAIALLADEKPVK
jgi:hypothetical protein